MGITVTDYDAAYGNTEHLDQTLFSLQFLYNSYKTEYAQLPLLRANISDVVKYSFSVDQGYMGPQFRCNERAVISYEMSVSQKVCDVLLIFYLESQTKTGRFAQYYDGYMRRKTNSKTNA